LNAGFNEVVEQLAGDLKAIVLTDQHLKYLLVTSHEFVDEDEHEDGDAHVDGDGQVGCQMVMAFRRCSEYLVDP
jgi:hypothetical protein